MNGFNKMNLLACLIAVLVNPCVFAADAYRERMIARHLAVPLTSSESLWLDSGQGKFPGIYTDFPAGSRLGGIILLHDLEANPDWPAVISPLRRSLPDKGWPTLSIQLPLLTPGVPPDTRALQEIHDEGMGRVKAAIDYFISRGIYNISLIGHGMGATVISAYLAGQLPENHAIYIKSFVAISPRLSEGLPQRYQLEHLLRQAKLPVLDVVSSQESPPDSAHTRSRRAAAQTAKNTGYRQLALPWPDNDFAGAEPLLFSRVHAWLKRYAAGTEVTLGNAED